jgi:hypothetical protein
MNEILNRNIDALASISTLFVITFGFSDSDKIVEAAALACKTAALEWYKKNGIEFDIRYEDLCPEALEYAGMKLLEIKQLAELSAKLKVLSEIYK